jgi:hypothetical protein
MPAFVVGGLLPDVNLPLVPNGDPINVRESWGKTTVLVMVHSPDCSRCQHYVDGLAPAADEFKIWDGRLLIVVPAAPSEAVRARAPFGQVVADEYARLAAAGSASVIVADRYGQIFYSSYAAASHELPPARDLEEWLKYLGTMCPE